MAHDDSELPEDGLSRRLRRELRAERAPEPWVRHALAVSGDLPLPRLESRWSMLFPHLAGLTLLVGLALAFLLRPEVGNALVESFMREARVAAPFRLPHVSPEMLLAWVSTPVLIFLLVQGSRGFPILHRRWPWR